MGTYQRNELTCNWSENAQPQLSQLVEPLWTDPGLKNEIGVHELISTFRKKHRQGLIKDKHRPGTNHHRSSPKVFGCEEKATTNEENAQIISASKQTNKTCLWKSIDSDSKQIRSAECTGQ